MSETEGLRDALADLRDATDRIARVVSAEIADLRRSLGDGQDLRTRAALLAYGALLAAPAAEAALSNPRSATGERLAALAWQWADAFVEAEFTAKPNGPPDHPPRGNLPMGRGG